MMNHVYTEQAYRGFNILVRCGREKGLWVIKQLYINRNGILFLPYRFDKAWIYDSSSAALEAGVAEGRRIVDDRYIRNGPAA